MASAHGDSAEPEDARRLGALRQAVEASGARLAREGDTLLVQVPPAWAAANPDAALDLMALAYKLAAGAARRHLLPLMEDGQ
jgi:hypothetical protein